MKIAYIQNMRLPTEKAHGYQIMKTCEALVNKGVELRLVIPKRKNHLIEDPFIFYNIKDNFQLILLPVIDYISIVPGILKPLAFYLERFSFLCALKKTQFTEGEVLYTRDAWIAARLKSFFNIQTFLEMHALPSLKTLKKCKNLDGIFCLTKWMQKEVDKMIPKMKTLWLPDAVDVKLFNPTNNKQQARQELGISDNIKMITYGGKFSTMESSKGLSSLDSAVAAIALKDKAVKLYLVGGSTEEFKHYENRSPSTNTICIPPVEREKLALYYRASNVLVMPFPNTKHYAHEMSPLKLFEYMASGTPIITSDLLSVRDVLDNDMAFFYELQSYDGLKKALLNIFKNPQIAIEKATNSFQIVFNLYTWDKRARKIITEINQK